MVAIRFAHAPDKYRDATLSSRVGIAVGLRVRACLAVRQVTKSLK